jgi:hypothetical protein
VIPDEYIPEYDNPHGKYKPAEIVMGALDRGIASPVIANE